MKNYLFRLFLLSIMLNCASGLLAQSCLPCNKTPRVMVFDLDVQVPKPADPKEFSDWEKLFWLARHARAKIYELNKNCVFFLQPLSVNSEGNLSLMVGPTHAVLPQEKNTGNTHYLITGSVTGSGNLYQMHLELRAVCNGKKVKEVVVPFNKNADTEQVAQQAVARLGLLSDRITAFEKKEREDNKDVAFGSSVKPASLKIRPQKTKLVKDEETEVEIILTDCDGQPLDGREISFAASELHGFKINGTTGGTVTPSKIVTDGQGRAKVKFKMTASKNATIAAHYLFNEPYGCKRAVTGSTPIGSIPVKLEIFYDITESKEINPNIKIGGAEALGGKQNLSYSRQYHSVIYHYPADPKESLVEITRQNENGSKTDYEYQDGFFDYQNLKQGSEGEVRLGGMKLSEVLEEKEEQVNSGMVRKKPGEEIYFSPGNEDDPLNFYLEFNYTNEGEDHDIGTGDFNNYIILKEGDPRTTVTRNKITDPRSPYKTEYILEYYGTPMLKLKDADEVLGTNVSETLDWMKMSGNEYLRVRILSPY